MLLMQYYVIQVILKYVNMIMRVYRHVNFNSISFNYKIETNQQNSVIIAIVYIWL